MESLWQTGPCKLSRPAWRVSCGYFIPPTPHPPSVPMSRRNGGYFLLPPPHNPFCLPKTTFKKVVRAQTPHRCEPGKGRDRPKRQNEAQKGEMGDKEREARGRRRRRGNKHTNTHLLILYSPFGGPTIRVPTWGVRSPPPLIRGVLLGGNPLLSRY